MLEITNKKFEIKNIKLDKTNKKLSLTNIETEEQLEISNINKNKEV